MYICSAKLLNIVIIYYSMNSSLSAPFCQKLLWKMDKLHKNYFPSVFFVRRFKMRMERGGFVREGKGRQAAMIKWVWKGATKEK